MAEDFPEDKYEFKPNPEQRSFREDFLHVADVNYFFTNPVKERNRLPRKISRKTNSKTKAEVAAYVKKSLPDGAAAIKEKGRCRLNSLSSHRMRISRCASLTCYGFMEHSGEHYGQLWCTTGSGLVPPESRPKKIEAKDVKEVKEVRESRPPMKWLGACASRPCLLFVCGDMRVTVCGETSVVKAHRAASEAPLTRATFESARKGRHLRRRFRGGLSAVRGSWLEASSFGRSRRRRGFAGGR